MSDDRLDRLFACARRERDAPSGNLMARIADDAASVAHERAAEAALATARDETPVPSEALLLRILTDAAEISDGRRAPAHAPRRRGVPPVRWLSPDLAAWSGLAAAGLAGLAFGFADPGGWVADLSDTPAGTEELAALGSDQVFATLWTGE